MQGEHDAAVQSLDNTEQLLSRILDWAPQPQRRPQDSLSDESSISDEDARSADRTAKPDSQAAEQSSNAQTLAVKTLLGKVLLAKASIFKQLKRTREANECMKSAKKMDPAIGKYVKD